LSEFAVCGELALEEAMDLLHDRLCGGGGGVVAVAVVVHLAEVTSLFSHYSLK